MFGSFNFFLLRLCAKTNSQRFRRFKMAPHIELNGEARLKCYDNSIGINAIALLCIGTNGHKHDDKNKNIEIINDKATSIGKKHGNKNQGKKEYLYRCDIAVRTLNIY